MWRLVLLYILTFLFSENSLAQPASNKPVSNLRKKLIPSRKEVIRLDTLSIIPNTLQIAGLSDTAYQIDYVNATISFKQQPALDTLFISYRVFNFKLNAVTGRLRY